MRGRFTETGGLRQPQWKVGAEWMRLAVVVWRISAGPLDSVSDCGRPRFSVRMCGFYMSCKRSHQSFAVGEARVGVSGDGDLTANVARQGV